MEQEEFAIQKAKSEIEKARLDLEYETNVKIVNELPSCNLTESRIKALEDKRVALLNRMEKHKQQLQKIVSICDDFEKILADNDSSSEVDAPLGSAEQPMHVD